MYDVVSNINGGGNVEFNLRIRRRRDTITVSHVKCLVDFGS